MKAAAAAHLHGRGVADGEHQENRNGAEVEGAGPGREVPGKHSHKASGKEHRHGPDASYGPPRPVRQPQDTGYSVVNILPSILSKRSRS